MSFDHTPLDAFTGILASRGDRPAIVRGSHGVSFADLDRMARTCGPAFADRQTGVVLAARNSAEVAALVLAAWRAGAYPVFVSPSAPAGHVQRARELTGALLVVHEEGQDGPAEPRLPPAPRGRSSMPGPGSAWDMSTTRSGRPAPAAPSVSTARKCPRSLPATSGGWMPTAT